MYMNFLKLSKLKCTILVILLVVVALFQVSTKAGSNWLKKGTDLSKIAGGRSYHPPESGQAYDRSPQASFWGKIDLFPSKGGNHDTR